MPVRAIALPQVFDPLDFVGGTIQASIDRHTYNVYLNGRLIKRLDGKPHGETFNLNPGQYQWADLG